MTDKTWLITGATQGIGLACAAQLAAAGSASLLVLARDVDRAQAQMAALGPGVTVLRCDLGSLASVREAAATIVQRLHSGAFPPLRALVLNAGMQTATGPLQYTIDGMEVAFATNHLAHFLLVNLLIDQINGPARIIFTASGTHDPDTIDGRFNKALFTNAHDLAFPEARQAPRMSHLQRYATSKLCNIYCAYELARRLQRSRRSTASAPITSNAYDPGAVPGTGLLREHGAVARYLFESPIVRWFTRVETVPEAGAALARLVIDPALRDITGRYFAGRRERASSRASYDKNAAARLWEESWQLVGLPAEPGASELSVKATRL